MTYQDPLVTTGGHRAYVQRNEPQTALRLKRTFAAALAALLTIAGVACLCGAAVGDHFMPAGNIGLGLLVLAAQCAGASVNAGDRLTQLEETHCVERRVMRAMSALSGQNERLNDRQEKILRGLDEILTVLDRNAQNLQEMKAEIRAIVGRLGQMEAVEQQMATAIAVKDEVGERRKESR